jgi:hypothetical protein
MHTVKSNEQIKITDSDLTLHKKQTQRQLIHASSHPSGSSTEVVGAAQFVAVPNENSVFFDKVLVKLPLPLQRFISIILTRARDPKSEAFHSNQMSSQGPTGPQTIGWLSILTLTSTLGVLSVAYAYTSARYGVLGGDPFFWFGTLLIFVPPLVRLISPVATRFERINLLCVIGICFYFIYVMNTPLGFSAFDGSVHWRTLDDITRSGHLFSENSLLPISPFYPGLEIVTNAFSTLSGLDTFHAGLIVIGIARLVMILSLFMLYEQVTKSARIAGIATLLYMTNPHFLFFDAAFSYESLALPLAALMLFTMLLHEKLNSNFVRVALTAWIILGAITFTHHMTDFVLDGLLILWTVLYGRQRPTRVLQSNLAKTSLFAILASVAWINFGGNPVVKYLSSYYGNALNELGQILTGISQARHLFSAYAGQSPPLWEQLTALSSVALILFCLPFGLLCLWQRYRYSAFACMLGAASLLYPISHVFRFTNFGSEITDRSAAFLFIPVAFVLAIFITQFWPTRRLNWKQTSLITCAISVVFLGGVILAIGPPWALLPGPYLVGADDHSVEPEGIQTAEWAYSYLGSNNRFATDRTNGLLMNTYGDQRPVTSTEDGIDVATIFFSPDLDPYEIARLKDVKVQYLLVDLRLSKAPPRLGFYFDPGEPGSFQHTTPISLKALTKFSTVPQINRVFDSGDIAIYDLGGLINAPEKP